MVKRKAYAKINLSLDVLRRREDGYHEVRMIMQNVGIYDVLSFERVDIASSSCELSTKKADESTNLEEAKKSLITLEVLNAPQGADLGPIEKNLIYRAAKLVYDKYQIKDGVKISLEKHIPVAAGMAGGSTDAAAAFHGLNELFNLQMTVEEMCELGVKIGADIPYCIVGGTAVSEGIGEILTPISAPPKAIILVAKPDINVSTKFVYENLHANELKVHPDVDEMIRAIEKKDLNKMAEVLGNVLETVTTKEYPIIEEIKDVMKENGALNSLMSGSGPTVFGIYDYNDRESAQKCAELIEEQGLSKEVFVTEFV